VAVPAARRFPRRPILLALLVAVAATVGVLGVVALTRAPAGDGGTAIAVDQPAPAIAGKTLDGAPFDLGELRGHPVVVNFWGPTCIPCRTEFPLLKSKLEEHSADGLVVVGVLMADPPDLARPFVAEQGATWPTVIDANGAIKSEYRVLARPQSYFIDRNGILRSIQIGEVQDADFERQYARIAGGS
jgi:cytochrome c biogenesis protein CcmG/thiol:disulfide interchange protein DsbE